MPFQDVLLLDRFGSNREDASFVDKGKREENYDRGETEL